MENLALYGALALFALTALAVGLVLLVAVARSFRRRPAAPAATIGEPLRPREAAPAPPLVVEDLLHDYRTRREQEQRRAEIRENLDKVISWASKPAGPPPNA